MYTIIILLTFITQKIHASSFKSALQKYCLPLLAVRVITKACTVLTEHIKCP